MLSCDFVHSRFMLVALAATLLASGAPSSLEGQASARPDDDLWEIELPLEEGFRRLEPEEEAVVVEEDDAEELEPEPEEPQEDVEALPHDEAERRSAYEWYVDEVATVREDDEEARRPERQPDREARRDAPAKRVTDDKLDEEPSEDESPPVDGDRHDTEIAVSMLARKLVAPEGTLEDIERLWERRREALARLDRAAADEATEALLDMRRQLGISALPRMSVALQREGREHLRRKDSSDALKSAKLAVAIAPDSAGAHWFEARALIADNPLQAGPILSSTWHALRSELRVIPQRRIHLANLLFNVSLGLILTGLCFLGLVVFRTLRHYLHDFHHLFPRGAARIQTGVVGLALLVAPVLLHAGLAVLVMVLTAAAWFHASWKERAVLAMTLVLLSTAPFLASVAAGHGSFWGTRAEEVWRLEHADGGASTVAVLDQRVREGSAHWTELFSLARHHKREGRLEQAFGLYQAALDERPREPIIHNNIGIVLYAQDDLEGALLAFRRATELNAASAAAWHNLSKVYFRTGEQGPGREARRRAVELDGSIMDEFPDAEARLNLALAEEVLSNRQILGLARAGNERGEDAARQIKVHLAGILPADMAPFLPVASLPLLFLAVVFVYRKSRPAASCVKCGRSACPRCDPEVGTGSLCGQCVSVFQNKKTVSQRARLLKEAKVRRHQSWREGSARAVSLILPGSGHILLDRPIAGALLLGVFLVGAMSLLLMLGPLPLVESAQAGIGMLRLVVGISLVAASWLVGNWALWRRDR